MTVLLEGGVLKKNRDWSFIYKEKNEQWIKRWYYLKYVICSNSIETKYIFTKREMNNVFFLFSLCLGQDGEESTPS